MGGRLWVESEAGQGSAFHFTVNVGVPAAAAAKGRIVEPEGLEGLDILVIDDNATNRRILSETLAGWRMRPVLAESAAGAVEIVRRFERAGGRFALVLVDAHMPDIDGFTLDRQMAEERTPGGPRILMLDSPDIARLGPELRQPGHYVVKPVTRASLLGAISRALGHGHRPSGAGGGHTPAIAGRSLHVLIAEDNPVNQKVASPCWRGRGTRWRWHPTERKRWRP